MGDLESEIAEAMGDESDPVTERCEAETGAGGDTYRCALQSGHDGEHAFAPVDETDTEGEPDPEPETDDPDALTASVERDKQWGRVTKYLAKNLGEIEGEDAVLYHECFVCRSFGSPGFIRMEQLSPEVVSTLHSWLGMRPADEYEADTHSRECDECAGLGLVAMPSKVQGQETMTCTGCGGLGWLGTDPKRGNFTSPPGNGSSPIPEDQRGAGAYDPLPDAPEPPEVEALRAAGYMVAKIPSLAS